MTDTTTSSQPASSTSSTDSNVSAIMQDIQTIGDGAAAAVEAVAKVSWWTALCGFFTALPGIISLIQSFMKWVNVVSGNNPQAFIANLGQGFQQLAAAKTQEDRQNAAQNLSKTIGNMPSS